MSWKPSELRGMFDLRMRRPVRLIRLLADLVHVGLAEVETAAARSLGHYYLNRIRKRF